MLTKILTVFVIVAALTAQAAAASERHHARTQSRAVASEQFRNSNAYAVPGDIAVQSGYDGAMGSGIAGH